MKTARRVTFEAPFVSVFFASVSAVGAVRAKRVREACCSEGFQPSVVHNVACYLRARNLKTARR
jgi:hypothetical protein